MQRQSKLAEVQAAFQSAAASVHLVASATSPCRQLLKLLNCTQRVVCGMQPLLTDVAGCFSYTAQACSVFSALRQYCLSAAAMRA